MLDELKVKEHPCWDDKTNKIVGICREHGAKVSLDYLSKDEADLLAVKLADGEVYLATKVRECLPMSTHQPCYSHYYISQQWLLWVQSQTKCVFIVFVPSLSQDLARERLERNI